MNHNVLISAGLVTAAAVLSGCAGEPTSLRGHSFLSASIEGDVAGAYVGGGNFRLVPHDTPGAVRFILHSRGTEEWVDRGFWFHSAVTPVGGERPLGGLDADTDQGVYWEEVDGRRRIFTTDSGMLELTSVTVDRVIGSFRMTAHLKYECVVDPAFPAPIITCEPAEADAQIKVSGWFQAAPLGAVAPGVIPSLEIW
jgi:hypothetical protein